MTYPKRLIEVDLPIKRISEHARREKSIRHGHISTLHIWWARRPLAACRAVLCAALWPDPADPECPPAFREAAATQIVTFARQVLAGKVPAESCSEASFGRWNTLARDDVALDASNPAHQNQLRYALLDFIADFANWDNSTVKAYLDTSRALTRAAHEALGGVPGTRPLVVDPFAGGGAIPLEALRVGADAFASDLNPVAVLLNKVVLEYIPKYGRELADEVRKWGTWVQEQAKEELAEFYPVDASGGVPEAYMWARTIRCEGPGCGAEIPLVRGLWLVRKARRSIALRIVPNKLNKRVDFAIVENATLKNIGEGTMKRGSATCPICGYTNPVARVRAQLTSRNGGTRDSRLLCVVTSLPGDHERHYRLPVAEDVIACHRAEVELGRQQESNVGDLTLVPDEPLPPQGTLGFRVQLYGMSTWGHLFTSRQALALATLARLVNTVGEKMSTGQQTGLAQATQACLALLVNKQADYSSSLCTWHYHNREKVNHTFARQALPFVWDFVETVFYGTGSGSWPGLLDWTELALVSANASDHSGHVEQASATAHPLPNESAAVIFTDPPYYDAVPYADLSDFFYVWFRRTLLRSEPTLFSGSLSPKTEECIADPGRDKDRRFYERTMAQAMSECRRIQDPNGIGIVVFAHKSTQGWEAQLQAMVDAGWTITGSWPIDTEMGTRLRAHDSAALASSIHLVCRPRIKSVHIEHAGNVGDWREVLATLPKRIRDWMPRLAQEGVVGADAIFACLGPALEIFSQYERVETAGGNVIALREYLEHVWASVGREALNQIFTGADPTGFEEDSRLTALWLWTLSGQVVKPDEEANDDDGADEDAEGAGIAKIVTGGFALEYDTARKLAQGTGVHLESLNRLGGVVEIKGNKSRLLGVAERRKTLLGAHGGDNAEAETKKTKRGRGAQMAFEAIEQAVGPMTKAGAADEELGEFKAGETTLDRIHQSMLLFGEGRSEALKRFLVEDGVGQDQRFWRLAQTLSALYPASSQEKRWVDGVLARKKGLGL